MRTYRHPLSRLPKPGYLSRRSLRTGAIVLGLVLLVDVVTARYFPQVQSALTLPPLHIASHTSSLQLPSMTNGVTAVTNLSTLTSAGELDFVQYQTVNADANPPIAPTFITETILAFDANNMVMTNGPSMMTATNFFNQNQAQTYFTLEAR